jgi:lysyl-tRNA synthetase class II
MIAIVNQGKPKKAKQKDERIYEVRINSKTLFAFTHNREEKLSVCLARAAEAAAQFEQLKNIVGNGKLIK